MVVSGVAHGTKRAAATPRTAACGPVTPVESGAYSEKVRPFPHVRVEPSSDIQETVVSGTLGYCRNELKVAITALGTGERRERSGYAMTVLRKNDQGRWLIARDASLLS